MTILKNIALILMLFALAASSLSGCGGQARADGLPDVSGAAAALALKAEYGESPDGTVWHAFANTTGHEVYRPSSAPGNIFGGTMHNMGVIVRIRNAPMLNPALPRRSLRDANGKLWCERINNSGTKLFTAYSSMADYIRPTASDPSFYKKNGDTGTDGTFTRASTAYYNASDGTWTAASSGAPRYGFANISSSSGKWQKAGCLVEWPTTNYVLNSAAPATQTIALTTLQQYTLWVEGTGTCQIAAGASSPATGTGWGTATASAPVVVNITGAGNVDLTVTGSLTRFQLENSFAQKAYILTTVAPATKPLDALSIPLPNPSAFDTAGTLAVEYVPEKPLANPTGTTYRFLFGTASGTSPGPLYIQINTNGNTYLKYYDGTNQPNVLITGGLKLKKYKLAVTWGAGTAKAYDITDSLSVSGSYDGSWNAGASLGVGQCLNGGNVVNGWIRTIRYWDHKLTDAEVATL